MGTKGRRRIAFYPGSIGGGGIARVFFNLMQTMLDDGIEVQLFLDNKSGALFSQIPEGVDLFFGRGKVKNSFLALRRFLQKEQPEALISAHAHVNIASVLALRTIKVPTKSIITIHTATSRDDRSGKPLRKRLNTLSSRLIYPLADNIVAVSDAVADDLAKYLKMDRKRIKTIYNPVVTPALLRKAAETAEHRFFGQALPVIISVGRLSEQKDFPNLLRAFALLKRQLDSRLIILGEGEDRTMLENMRSELGLDGYVDLPGFVDNPYAFMAASDLFVSSSAWEGLPTVLIEAMAAGANVVATDCPGGSREILDNGKYGAMVPVGDSEALAEAMLAALREPLDKNLLSKRAMSFSARAATENYLSLIADEVT